MFRNFVGMEKQVKHRPKDTNQLAKFIVDLSTNMDEEDSKKKDLKGKPAVKKVALPKR